MIGLFIEPDYFIKRADTARHAVLRSDILHLKAEANSLRSFYPIYEHLFISYFENFDISSYLSVCSASWAIDLSSSILLIFKY